MSQMGGKLFSNGLTRDQLHVLYLRVAMVRLRWESEKTHDRIVLLSWCLPFSALRAHHRACRRLPPRGRETIRHQSPLAQYRLQPDTVPHESASFVVVFSCTSPHESFLP